MQRPLAYVVNRVISSIHNTGSLRWNNFASRHSPYVYHCKSGLCERPSNLQFKVENKDCGIYYVSYKHKIYLKFVIGICLFIPYKFIIDSFCVYMHVRIYVFACSACAVCMQFKYNSELLNGCSAKCFSTSGTRTASCPRLYLCWAASSN
jgi:hypothetical protein